MYNAQNYMIYFSMLSRRLNSICQMVSNEGSGRQSPLASREALRCPLFCEQVSALQESPDSVTARDKEE